METPTRTDHGMRFTQNLSGRGKVYSFSTMYNAPQGYEDQKPYTIALVKLEDGPMVTAQLTDVEPGDVQIGMQVEMVTRKLREDGPEGQIVYGYKFRPVFGRGT
ncbi:MAG: hypothetical protein DCC55_02325 [Chloroflexi bacterium]|nr:MAG: hypothetical protein DCC55_02325 [Chloroflexota bacterium]